MSKTMAVIKKGMHFLASVFMYSVLLLMLIIFVTVIIYVLEQKQNASKDRYVAPIFSAYVIITNSMDPVIKVNDVVIDRRVPASSIKVGDIITFVSNDPIAYGKTITHRVTGKDQDKDGYFRFRTKGDNNNVQDNWIVSETHILGKVMFKIPMLGYVQQFLATSYGWIAAIVLPCLVIIIYDIVKLVGTLIRSSKRQKKEIPAKTPVIPPAEPKPTSHPIYPDVNQQINSSDEPSLQKGVQDEPRDDDKQT